MGLQRPGRVAARSEDLCFGGHPWNLRWSKGEASPSTGAYSHLSDSAQPLSERARPLPGCRPEPPLRRDFQALSRPLHYSVLRISPACNGRQLCPASPGPPVPSAHHIIVVRIASWRLGRLPLRRTRIERLDRLSAADTNKQDGYSYQQAVESLKCTHNFL